MPETLALFGTSADPPTIGHRAILSGLAQRYDRVLVWAVDNPFKGNQTSLCHRQQMLKILLESMVPPLSNVNWMPEISDRRSLKSVRQVQLLWPEAQLVLVVGSDILSSLQDWYAIDRLIQSVQFLIIPRLGFSIVEDQLTALRAKGGHYKVADFDCPRVSSSDFRLHHRSDGLSDEILAYVMAHDLYQAEDVHV